MKTATCFFCYAWDDDGVRFNKLEFLRKNIEDASSDRIEVILDKHTYEDNADFDELRERIRSYDIVVIFFTPDFKEIIIDREAIKNKKREVLREYDIVMERYKEDKDSVFPVILEGNKTSSLPEEFFSRNVRMYESFNITWNDKRRYCIPNSSKREYNKFIDKIIRTALFNCTDRSEEYRTAEEALEKLFGLTANVSIPQSCLVVPDLYNKIRSQSCMFVAGRKGSGKSTFIRNFREMGREYFDEHYKKMLPISAESFNYDIAYELMFAKHVNDKDVVEQYTVMCLFWQVYFVLYCIVIIRVEIEDKIITKENDKRYDVFNRVSRNLFKHLGLEIGQGSTDLENTEVIKQLFITAAELVDNKFSSALKVINSDKVILSQFSSKFTLTSIIEELFSQRDAAEFVKGVRKCGKRIMISLDGFDTHSEDFRITTSRLDPDSDEFKTREDFERLFFRTMLEVVMQFKDKQIKDKLGSQIAEIMDFCIVLPKDRYDQVITGDRDGIKRNFGTLSWSALELQELLTKRLEYLIRKIDSSYSIDDSKGYEERMNEALSFFPALPPLWR